MVVYQRYDRWFAIHERLKRLLRTSLFAALGAPFTARKSRARSSPDNFEPRSLPVKCLLGPRQLANNRYMDKVHSVHSAKTHLSKLIERAEAGESIVIARGKIPAVRLVPVKSVPPRRKFGAMKGRAHVTRAFFSPLPDDELKAWGS